MKGWYSWVFNICDAPGPNVHYVALLTFWVRYIFSSLKISYFTSDTILRKLALYYWAFNAGNYLSR